MDKGTVHMQRGAYLCLPYAGSGQYITNMCLYPRLIKNPKYLPNKKNGGFVPKAKDHRIKWVAIGCGECIECKQKKSREWRVRLGEEFKENQQCQFITLTFSDKNLIKYRALASKEIEKSTDTYCDIWEVDNQAARIAVRHMLERYRKKYGHSVRHWLITERGHKNTKRIHLHGLIWHEFKGSNYRGRGGELQKLWANGWTYTGTYVGNKTITYISKYITKSDNDNKYYHGKIFASPGIGKRYITSRGAKRNRFELKKTDTRYILNNGRAIDLPMYYRNHLYTEEQREYLWIKILNEKARYVLGHRIDIQYGEERYDNAVSIARGINKTAGYPMPEWATDEWHKKYIKRNLIINNIEPNLGFSIKNNNFTVLNTNTETWPINLQQTNKHERSNNTIRTKANKQGTNPNNTNLGDGNNLGHYGTCQKGDDSTRQRLCDNHNKGAGEIHGDYPYMAPERNQTTIDNRIINIYDNENNTNARRKRHNLHELYREIGVDSKAERRTMDRQNSTRRDETIRNNTGYQVINTETGEIYDNATYQRIKNQLKTISYEKTKRKGVKADGSTYYWYSTKRFVRQIGHDQLELF